MLVFLNYKTTLICKLVIIRLYNKITMRFLLIDRTDRQTQGLTLCLNLTESFKKCIY